MSTRRVAINLPKSGMGIDEATVARWLKKVGDSVQRDEVLVEVETAKAVEEVQSPASGKLVEILVGEGETGMVNHPLGAIEVSGE